MSWLTPFKSVLSFSRELWAMIFLKILFSYSYFSLSSTLVVYLSQDHGFSDVGAADVYSAWGLSMSITQFFCGPLIDRLQIRRSLVVGSLILTIGMFIIALTVDNRPLLLFSLLFVIPVGSALGLSVIDIGSKRYSPRGGGVMNMVFAISYSSMNLGASATGATIEFLHQQYGGKEVVYMDYHASNERFLILIGAVVTAIAGLIVALIVKDEPVQTQHDLELANIRMPGTAASTAVASVNTEDDGEYLDEALPARNRKCYCCVQRCSWICSTWQWIKADVLPVLRNSYFHRLLVFSTVMIGVRIVYRHIDATFPKVIMRAFGDNAHYGALYSINPTMIIFITPIISGITANFDIYNVMIFGTLVAAASMFIMSAELTLLSVVSWAVVFTIGEAIYSPLSGVYIMSIAPDQREGLYTSLAYAPNLLAKVIVGPMSGSLLEQYCPKNGPFDQCKNVWFYIGIGALSTPALLTALKCYIHNGAVAVRIQARLLDSAGLHS